MTLLNSAKRLVREPLYRIVVRARVQEPWRRRKFAAFGANSILHKPLWIARPDKIAVGQRVLILSGMWLAVENTAWDRPGPAIVIGDDVAIRPHVTISAGERVVIEDGVVIAAFTTIIDSDHTFANGIPNGLRNPIVTAPVRVGAGTWIGERVAVLRGADIGRCCIIGSNSVVSGEIPDYSIAVGVPARVVGSTREQFERAGAPA